MKKITKILFVLLFGTLVLCNRTHAKSLDSGDPSIRVYTNEIVYKFIGKKATITYIENDIENKIVLNVIGILFDRTDKIGNVLLGKHKMRNRITIPIEKIILIEEIL